MAAALLRAPSAHGLLSGLAAEQAERVVMLVQLLIGATDIERHGVHMAAFAAHWGDGAAEPAAAEDGTLKDASARESLLALLLKSADVSNAAKPWPLAARWAGLLKAEHLLLGASPAYVRLPFAGADSHPPPPPAAEREVDAGLTVTPFLKLPIPQLCKVRCLPASAPPVLGPLLCL